MIPEKITGEKDPCTKAWAMIYFVADELLGKKEADDEAQQIINQIAELRVGGALTSEQMAVLDDMQRYRVRNSDYDF